LRRHLAATVACGAVVAATTIASAVLLAHVLARAVTDPGSRTLGHWAIPLAVLAGLWSVRAVVGWLQARLAQRGATAVIADLSEQVLRSVTARAPSHFADVSGDAAAVITRGLDGLRPYFTSYLPALVLAAVLTPATLAVIAIYDRLSAATVVITLPLIPLFMVLIGLATRSRSEAALAATITLQARLLDLVAGIPTLRALGRAGGSVRRIAELAAAHRRSTMATLRMAFLSALVLELLAALGVALVAVGVGLRLVYGEMSLSAGLTALLLAPEVFWPLRRVGAEFHAAQDGKSAADMAFELIGESAGRTQGTRSVQARGAELRMDRVTVVGRDGPRPESLSAVMEPGSVTVLTGPNGAGKSTALQVILGITEPTSGRVTIGGVDLADLDLESWWRQISWLAQRPAIVPGTVSENLNLFGKLDDCGSACQQAGFDCVLETLPLGLHTVLGRGGAGLSLGQRQRLGLARTLGSPASVLLLDEPTAHLDTATEAKVLTAITDRARRGDTVIVVTHRDRVLDIADEVIDVGRDRALA
jgi:ATP-binding cassette, subfamily C, bacterial CydD